MEMVRSTCDITTNPPTDDDIHDCQWNIPTDEFDWYPSNNLFDISSMEEEYRKNSNFHPCINIVESRILRAPPTIKCGDDLVIH